MILLSVVVVKTNGAMQYHDQQQAIESDPLLSHRQENGATEDDSSSVDSDHDENDNASQATSLLGTITENIEEFIDETFEVASTFVDNVVDELNEVADAFAEELQDVGDDKDSKHFFLEMNLTRNLSLLPGDMVDASNYVKESFAPLPDPDVHKKEHVEQEHLAMPTIDEGKAFLTEIEVKETKRKEKEIPGIPLSAYFLLATAVFSLSSIGPLLDFQTGVGSTMKVFWRTSATSCVLLPFAIRSIVRDGIPVMNRTEWVMLFLTMACYAAMCIFFVWALEWTAVGNALIFSNSQAMILLVGKLFVGEAVSRMEGSGAVIAFIGAILCSQDSADAASGATLRRYGTLLGDLFAILSAIAGVGYVVLAKTVRPRMDLYFFMFCIMTGGSLWSLLSVYVAGERVSFDIDAKHGIFGWMSPSANRLLTELVMVLICNLFGSMG